MSHKNILHIKLPPLLKDHTFFLNPSINIKNDTPLLAISRNLYLPLKRRGSSHCANMKY